MNRNSSIMYNLCKGSCRDGRNKGRQVLNVYSWQRDSMYTDSCLFLYFSLGVFSWEINNYKIYELIKIINRTNTFQPKPDCTL